MKSKNTNPNDMANDGEDDGPIDASSFPEGPTGRKLVVLRPGSQKSLSKSLKDTAGLAAASTADLDDAVVHEGNIGKAYALIFEHLNIAVIDGDADQVSSLEAAVEDVSNPILSIEDEQYVHAFSDEEGYAASGGLLTAEGASFLRGYLAAVKSLTAQLLADGATDAEAHEIVQTTFADTTAATWGLQAVKAVSSPYNGVGIRVAVLDTGFDVNHPDFAGRTVLTASFVPNELVQDGHGHGTHCIGTASGTRMNANLPVPARRYGVAGASTILAGKVLSNAGSGQGGWIINGINWAIQQKAVVISMSLGSSVPIGGGFSPAYEQAGQAALAANVLIVAAAGNSGNSQPVGSPANCPSFMSVGALAQSLNLAPFSCTAINPGQSVDIAAPGVGTFSSVPMPTRYGVKSGTSMATPHVAGCAVLWAQSSGLRGKALWNKLTATAANVSLPVNQVGAGLVQAPIFRWPPVLVPPILRIPKPKLPIPNPGPIKRLKK